VSVRKLVLRNHQSPGDIVMLSAAVRDLHFTHPGAFLTDVRTPCSQLWENNPCITPIADDDPAAEHIECHYPLIHSSNQLPHHFVQGFTAYLADRLQIPIETTAFKGDIHLAPQEKTWKSQVEEIVGIDLPFWIVVAGGKRDFTVKWWSHERFQAVVDRFRGRLLFVQVGVAEHHHPRLRGALDLVGRTDLRQLVRLVYHAQGVLCPVTLHMHLAAAIEVKGGRPKNRACVVVAGGREPPHWEAYPSHQFVHTVGALLCCDNGGCWKARTEQLGDGDSKDESRCVDVVNHLPRCMDMITADEIVGRVERYVAGGAARYLSSGEGRAVTETTGLWGETTRRLQHGSLAEVI
jgi:ADP-heptose:LPS heptosyltransferase